MAPCSEADGQHKRDSMFFVCWLFYFLFLGVCILLLLLFEIFVFYCVSVYLLCCLVIYLFIEKKNIKGREGIRKDLEGVRERKEYNQNILHEFFKSH